MRKFIGMQQINDKFVIVLQSHRCNKFSIRDSTHMGYTFKASNGIELSSSSCPDPCGNILYMRGDDDRRHVDWRLMEIEDHMIDLYMEAVREYNKNNK